MRTCAAAANPHCAVGTASPTTEGLDSRAFTRLRNRADPRYRIAAINVSDFSPNHSDADSRSPPNRFEPSALPRKPARAKLDTKMIPAKKTGVHNARVAARARNVHDSRN